MIKIKPSKIVSNWIVLQGEAKHGKSKISYESTPATTVKTGPNAGQSIGVILKSDKYFQNGSISFQVMISTPDSKCQIIFNQFLETEYFVGLNFGGAAYGIAGFRSGEWTQLAATGFGQSPSLKEWIPVRITVTGSEISLFINDIRVIAGSAPIAKAQLAIWLCGSGSIEVKDVVVDEIKSKVFVVMQFTEEYNSLYTEVIRPTCEDFGYECVRADDIYNNGSIIEDIVQSIRESSLVIADVTPDNPNVFYEVGFAHGIQKPTILLSDRKREKLPFDVSGVRTLFYDNSIGGKSTIEDRLRKHLEKLRA